MVHMGEPPTDHKMGRVARSMGRVARSFHFKTLGIPNICIYKFPLNKMHYINYISTILLRVSFAH